MKPSAIIVEDDEELREALVLALEASGIHVCGAFGSGEEALAASGELRMDVALVDLGLPGISGAQTIRALRARVQDLPALVLSVFEDPQSVVEAIEAGASGYLLKGTPMRQVAQAVIDVREGLAPISPAVARHLLDRVRSERRCASAGLTQRETEILELLVRGHTYASTGLALGIGLGTVQSHVKNVYRKLEVSSKAEATAVAIREGIVR